MKLYCCNLLCVCMPVSLRMCVCRYVHVFWPSLGIHRSSIFVSFSFSHQYFTLLPPLSFVSPAFTPSLSLSRPSESDYSPTTLQTPSLFSPRSVEAPPCWPESRRDGVRERRRSPDGSWSLFLTLWAESADRWEEIFWGRRSGWCGRGSSRCSPPFPNPSLRPQGSLSATADPL